MILITRPEDDAKKLSMILDDEKIVIIDLRNKIDKGSYESFLQGHIPGAIHSDYLKDGWRVGRDGVVGLLPQAEQFEGLARRLGVSDDTHVVVVPAGVSSTDFGSAARAYWTFKVFGHDNVSVLDGGYAAWRAFAPGKIETGAFIAPEPGSFVARFNPQYYIGKADVALRRCRFIAASSGCAETPIWRWGYVETLSTSLHLIELGFDAEGRAMLALAKAMQMVSI
mgnify:CR=1 FL=1